MNINQIIEKKKKGIVLGFEELSFVFNGFFKDEISKQDMTRFLNVFKASKYSFEETKTLTSIMISSGKTYDLSMFEKTIDKHSTGGVSDSTTFIVVPLFALFGFTSIKMSGARLGHTGGTADKILVFEGLKNNLNQQETFEIAKKVGACFVTSSEEIAPLDKKVYALRDEIGAMSVGLIASSIMSKKIATANKNLVLDVKFGNGALLKTKKEAKTLAKTMQKIGNSFGVNTSYVLGQMNQPLGSCIGNFLETFEAVETLKQKHISPLLHHSLKLVATALHKSLKTTKRDVYKQAKQFVFSGAALSKLQEIVEAQGGNFKLKQPKPSFVVLAEKQGKVRQVLTEKIGLLDKEFSSTKQNYFGFKILVRKGQKVLKNQPIFEVYFEDKNTKNISKLLNDTLKIF